jgi:hypothetical protein
VFEERVQLKKRNKGAEMRKELLRGRCGLCENEKRRRKIF